MYLSVILDPDFLHLKLGLHSWGGEGTCNTFLASAGLAASLRILNGGTLFSCM